jgi:hypothetical protein
MYVSPFLVGILFSFIYVTRDIVDKNNNYIDKCMVYLAKKKVINMKMAHIILIKNIK